MADPWCYILGVSLFIAVFCLTLSVKKNYDLTAKIEQREEQLKRVLDIFSKMEVVDSDQLRRNEHG